MAAGTIRAGKDHDLRISEDIQVVGFYDIEIAALLEPPPCSVKAHSPEMGASSLKWSSTMAFVGCGLPLYPRA